VLCAAQGGSNIHEYFIPHPVSPKQLVSNINAWPNLQLCPRLSLPTPLSLGYTVFKLSLTVDPLPQRFLAFGEFPANGLHPRDSFTPETLLFLFHLALILRTLVQDASA
jgi:hypothetical protein